MEKPNQSQLRKSFLKKRDALTPITRAHDSAIIRHRVLHHPAWRKARTILAYVSFRSEVDTHKLIKEALDQQKRVVVPISSSTQEIVLSELQTYGDLAPGPYHGIFEPAVTLRKPANLPEVELVLVPGAVFDSQGGRIGFGGGYFDRLLAKIPKACRLGLAFSVQMSPRPLPLHAHDVRMNILITEKEAITIP